MTFRPGVAFALAAFHLLENAVMPDKP